LLIKYYDIASFFLEKWVSYPFDADVARPAEQLTSASLETSVTYDRPPVFDRVWVGKTINVTAHPNAYLTNTCEGDWGAIHATKTMMCGAKNVAVALIGAALSNNFKLKPRTIRGVASEGTLCSTKELARDGLFTQSGQCTRYLGSAF
jgi:phenylalanyl-tRNA synthetase beta chain